MTVYNLLQEQIKKNPEGIAIIFGDKKISYEQLDNEINNLSSYLIESGIKSGDLAGVSVKRSPEMVITLLSLIKIGAAYLPLDPSFPSNRLKFIIEDSRCSFLITESTLNDFYSYYDGKLINVEEYKSHSRPKPEGFDVDENSLAYILYTSGSTGNPKGVQITHKSLLNFLHSMEKTPGFSSADSLLAITTLSFDISGLEIFLPLVTGAKLIIASKEETIDGKLLLALLKENITVMQATPSTWKLLLDSGWNEKLKLKALCGGEALSRDLADKILERVDSLWNMYGPTETTIWSSCAKIEAGKGLIHLGKPISNTQFYIVDKNNQFCAPGVPGELLIGGDGLSIGYLNREELTREKFIVNPFDKEKKSKVYRTGDLVKITPKKEIEFLGRIDNQVKIRGFRIELGEIENVIRKNIHVKEAAVIVKEFDNNDKKLVAYFVPNTNSSNGNNAGSAHIANWQSEWNYLYNTAIDHNKKNGSVEFNLDFAVTSELTQNEKHLTEGFNEWLSQTLDRIIALKPKRVLEIGCGGGQLLKKIAPLCDHYAATDFAESSIKILQTQVSRDSAIAGKVDLLVKAADDDLPFEKKSFDTIIVNSVVQYFPSPEYLVSVLNNLVDYLTDGGCLYLGDIQSKSLLRNHHINDQLGHLPMNTTVSGLKKLVEHRIELEEELVVDPDLFYAMKNINSKVGRVEVMLRRGKALNETTQYHYDVFIYAGILVKDEVTCEEVFWGNELKTYEELEFILSNEKPEIFYLCDLPRKRISANLEREKKIYSSPDNKLISEILSAIEEKDNLIDPEDLWALGKKYNCTADLIFPGNSDKAKIDVVFKTNNKNIKYKIRNSHVITNDLSAYANNPSLSKKNKNIVSAIKEEIAGQLPEYMIPSFIIPIEKIPLTPNGKIDIKELMKYDVQDIVLSRAIVQPETPFQELLLKIWKNLLAIETISTEDNFFELGGHSILAAQMFTELEKETGRRLPLATLFKHQTILEIAEAFESEQCDESWSPLVFIKLGKSKSPLFLVHGAEGNVLLYRDLANYINSDNPVYALQSRGLRGKEFIPGSIAEMADDYVDAIKLVKPEGPYRLGGYCMGGTIAYEMAQRLNELGDEVSILFLLETYNAHLIKDAFSFTTKTREKIENLKFHFENIKALKGKDRSSFIRSKTETAIRRTTARMGMMKSKIGIDLDKVDESDYMTRTLREINEVSQCNYIPSQYNGKTVLLRPRISFESEPDPNFGWENYITGEFRIFNLDVAPRGMLTDPFVKQTAKIIESFLSEDHADKLIK